jgi:hypothetical protein
MRINKSVDVCHHFVREQHHEKKDFFVKHVKSEENESGILRKNTTEKILKGDTPITSDQKWDFDGLEGLLEDC